MSSNDVEMKDAGSQREGSVDNGTESETENFRMIGGEGSRAQSELGRDDRSVTGEGTEGELKRRRTARTLSPEVRESPDDQYPYEWYNVSPKTAEWLTVEMNRDANLDEIIQSFEIKYGSAESLGWDRVCNGHERVIWYWFCKGMETLPAVTDGVFPPLPDFNDESENQRDALDRGIGSFLTVTDSGPGSSIRRTRFFRGTFKYGIQQGVKARFSGTKKYRDDRSEKIDEEWPALCMDSRDGLYEISRGKDSRRTYGKTDCCFCRMPDQKSTPGGAPDKHDPITCPLMLEGRNPTGFEGEPYEYGRFYAYAHFALRSRPCISIKKSALRRRLTYLWLDRDPLPPQYNETLEAQRLIVAAGISETWGRYRLWNPPNDWWQPDASSNWSGRSSWDWDAASSSSWQTNKSDQDRSDQGNRVQVGNGVYGVQMVATPEIEALMTRITESERVGEKPIFGLDINWLEETYGVFAKEELDFPAEHQERNLAAVSLGVSSHALTHLREFAQQHKSFRCEMCVDEVDGREYSVIEDEIRNAIPMYAEVMDRSPYVFGKGRKGTLARWVEDLGTRATEKLICVCPRHMTHKILEELTMQVQFESFIQNKRFLKNFTVNPQIVIGVCTGGHCMNRNKALLFSTSPNRSAFERELHKDFPGEPLEYACVECICFCYEHALHIDLHCVRCTNQVSHREVWTGSVMRGPVCYPCLTSHWEEGTCPLCEKFVVNLSDWVNISRSGEPKVFVCGLCVANASHPMFGVTAIWKPMVDFTSEELSSVPDPESRTFLKKNVAAARKGDRWLKDRQKRDQESKSKPVGDTASSLETAFKEMTVTSKAVGAGVLSTPLAECSGYEEIAAAMTLVSGMGIRLPYELMEKLERSAQVTIQGIIAQTDKQDELALLLRQTGHKMIKVDRTKASGSEDERKAYVESLLEETVKEHEGTQAFIRNLLNEMLVGDVATLAGKKVQFTYTREAVPQELLDKGNSEVDKEIEDANEEIRREKRAAAEDTRKAAADGGKVLKEIDAETVRSSVVDPKLPDGPRDAALGKSQVKAETGEPSARRRKKGSILAEALGSIEENRELNELNPRYNHGEAMRANLAVREHALWFDVSDGKVITGTSAERFQKEKTARDQGHELRRAVTVINDREVYVISTDPVESRNVESFRTDYFPACGDKKVSKFGLMRFPGSGTNCAGYTIPGTIDFGVHLMCGASDGVDVAPKKSGRVLYSLGRPPRAEQETGSKQPLKPACVREDCRSELHGFRSDLFVTRSLYIGDGKDNKGYAGAQFQLYAGRPEENSVESLHISLFDDFYVPEFVVLSDREWGKDPKYAFIIDVIGSCSLCGKVLEMQVPAKEFLKITQIYPEGIIDHKRYFQAQGTVTLDDEDELFTTTGTELLSWQKKYGQHGADPTFEYILQHLQSQHHKEREIMIEAMNGLLGRTKATCGDRYVNDRITKETNSISLWGREFHFRATCLIPVPCIEGVRDFIGADFEAASIHVWAMLFKERVLVDIGDGRHVQVRPQDVKMVTPCIMSWDQEKDGMSSNHGQYSSGNNHIVDVAFLPATYEEYFKNIGLKPPVRMSDSSVGPPTEWSEILDEQVHGSNGVPLTKDFLLEMLRRRVEEKEDLRCDTDAERTAAERFYEETLPFGNASQSWWFGVQLRLDPEGGLLNDSKEIVDFFEGKTVVICMDQLYRHTYIHGKKAGVEEGYYCVGWVSKGGLMSMGHGFTRKLEALRLEASYNERKGKTLSAAEKYLLTVSDEVLYETGAKLLNAIHAKRREATLSSSSLVEGLYASRNDELPKVKKPLSSVLPKGSAAPPQSRLQEDVRVPGTTRSGNVRRDSSSGSQNSRDSWASGSSMRESDRVSATSGSSYSRQRPGRDEQRK